MVQTSNDTFLKLLTKCVYSQPGIPITCTNAMIEGKQKECVCPYIDNQIVCLSKFCPNNFDTRCLPNYLQYAELGCDNEPSPNSSVGATATITPNAASHVRFKRFYFVVLAVGAIFI